MLDWFGAGIAAVDPEELTRSHLAASDGPATVFALGKAAAAMCRGAGRALGAIVGLCVTASPGPVPAGVDLVVGDHPVPGDASLAAGRRVLDLAAEASGRCLVLVSGGGSALCEWPASGVDPATIARVAALMLEAGAPIDDLNLVRGHLSALKSGGLARALGRPVETLVLSDVAGRDPGLVASGPTITTPRDPERVIAILTDLGVAVGGDLERALRETPPAPPVGPVVVIGDGMTAARSLAEAAAGDGVDVEVLPGWMTGEVPAALDRLLGPRRPGLVVGAGELDVAVTGAGAGGRNTHAALEAAIRVAGTNASFAALATDGVDGRSGSAGAVVDGGTIDRGGDPAGALAGCDSAAYLEGTGDLVVTGPTGTNVGDLFVVWHY
jgi:glycerate-2-kinase